MKQAWSGNRTPTSGMPIGRVNYLTTTLLLLFGGLCIWIEIIRQYKFHYQQIYFVFSVISLTHLRSQRFLPVRIYPSGKCQCHGKFVLSTEFEF